MDMNAHVHVNVDVDTVRAITRAVGAELPPERLAQLAGTLATLREGMTRLRGSDPGDAEPPCLTFDEEARP